MIEKVGPLLTCLQNALQESHEWQGIFNALVDLVDEPLCLSLADNYAGEDETAGSAEDQKCVALVGEMTKALLMALDFLNKEHNSNAAFFQQVSWMTWSGMAGSLANGQGASVSPTVQAQGPQSDVP